MCERCITVLLVVSWIYTSAGCHRSSSVVSLRALQAMLSDLPALIVPDLELSGVGPSSCSGVLFANHECAPSLSEWDWTAFSPCNIVVGSIILHIFRISQRGLGVVPALRGHKDKH
eukprot:5650954-Amphidinium_carterae.1